MVVVVVVVVIIIKKKIKLPFVYIFDPNSSPFSSISIAFPFPRISLNWEVLSSRDEADSSHLRSAYRSRGLIQRPREKSGGLQSSDRQIKTSGEGANSADLHFFFSFTPFSLQNPLNFSSCAVDLDLWLRD